MVINLVLIPTNLNQGPEACPENGNEARVAASPVKVPAVKKVENAIMVVKVDPVKVPAVRKVANVITVATVVVILKNAKSMASTIFAITIVVVGQAVLKAAVEVMVP